MPPPPLTRFPSSAPAALCACLAVGAASAERPGPVPPSPDAAHRLASLNRLVRHFDFEEARHAPYEMPFHFFRTGPDEAGAAHGFPPFGAMRLSNRAAYSGEWSFEFSLDGGSLAARVPTAVIPAMPRADYLVTTRVRTAGLTHARARLVAWLHDAEGRIIPESRALSRFVRTDGEWETLAVEVRGEYDDVSDLALELQLLQPRQFTSVPPHASPQASPEGSPEASQPQPLLEDVAGFAWFDDVSVWHLPRLEMTTAEPANLFVRPQRPAITVLVRDAAATEMEARLRVLDLDGRVVYERHFASPLLPSPRRVELPIETCGWYRAVLEVVSEGETAAARTLDFALLATPASARHVAASAGRTFAVALDESWLERVDELPSILRRLRAGSVVVPVWRRDTTVRSARSAYEAAHSALHELVRDRIEIVFWLESVPDELALALDLGSDEVVAALGRDPSIWRDFLHDLLINFGLEVRRWQIGALAASPPPDAQATAEGPLRLKRDSRLRGNGGAAGAAAPQIARAARVLGEFVPNPVLSIVIGADREPAAPLEAMTVNVPYEISPEAIPVYAAAWTADEVSARIEPLPERDFTRRSRINDLAFRALNAWRADADAITIESPWRTGDGAGLQPDPAFVLWRQLALHLGGRQFGGELTLGHDHGKLRCWILQGIEPGDMGLLAWVEQAENDPPRTISLQLALGNVDVYDLFGNRRIVEPAGGVHTFEVGASPVFLEQVNVALVQFRGGFALSPPFVPAEHRIHEHELVLRNPWPIPVSGSLVLTEGEAWRASPRAHAFTIRPMSEVRLPVELTFDRSVIAGPKRLEAEVTLAAEGVFQFSISADFEVGLSHLDSDATWRVVRNVETGRDDLVITQFITNKGDQPVSAEAFLIAPAEANLRQQRRIVMGLEPGELAIRRFQIPDGARLLAGSSLRLGVTDRGGHARLNHLLHIPDFVGEQRPGRSHARAVE